MITEDYISFETAKLLKEKMFDVPCNCYGAYNGVNLTYRLCITDKYTNWNKHSDKFIISCPTLQIAMKWLREIHKLYIEITPSSRTNEFIVDSYRIDIVTRFFDTIYISSGYNTYEEACEAAIKYCLEHLI